MGVGTRVYRSGWRGDIGVLNYYRDELYNRIGLDIRGFDMFFSSDIGDRAL